MDVHISRDGVVLNTIVVNSLDEAQTAYPDCDCSERISEVPTPYLITRFAFEARFAVMELVAIEIASIDNSTASQEARSFSAILRVERHLLDIANYIDLNNQQTIDGVKALEQAGLLGPGRAAQILTAPITQAEMFIPPGA